MYMHVYILCTHNNLHSTYTVHDKYRVHVHVHIEAVIQAIELVVNFSLFLLSSLNSFFHCGTLCT